MSKYYFFLWILVFFLSNNPFINGLFIIGKEKFYTFLLKRIIKKGISHEGRILQDDYSINITQNLTTSDYYAVEPFQLANIFLKNEFKNRIKKNYLFNKKGNCWMII
jgi:hypothetical protein